MPEDEEKRPLITHLVPPEDSHMEVPPTKCVFCDRPATTVVKGYPVCEEHAEMLEKGEITPPARAPPEVGTEPEIAEKS